MATWAIGKTFHVIRGRVVCIIVFIVSIWSDLLVFCWWFMSNIRMFSFNSIGCVTKCGPYGTWGNTNSYACKANVLKSSYRKIWSNILTAREEQAHGATKWIKNNSLMIPPWIWFRVKNMLNSTISGELPDVVIACIEHKVSLEAFRAIESWWLSIIIQRLFCGWLITITANHSNYLVCDRLTRLSLSGKW